MAFSHADLWSEPHYRRLGREATLRFSVSPFGSPGAGPDHPFQYDHTFDYYPLEYVRPGPVMRVYELRGCSAKGGRVSAAPHT